MGRLKFAGFLLGLVLVFGPVFGAPDLYAQSATVTAVCVAPDNRLLVGSDRGLFLHDIKTLAALQKIDCQLEKIYSIKVSPLGNAVAVSGGSPAESGAVEVFSTPGWNRLQRHEFHEDVATDVVWVSDTVLVSCGMDGNGCRIDLASNEPAQIQSRHSQGVLAIEHLAENVVVSAGQDNAIRVWGDPNKVRTLNNHTMAINDLALRELAIPETNRVLASVSDDYTVRFWQPQIGRLIRFVRLESIPTCVIWNAAGTQAIAGCRDGRLRVVDFATAKVVKTLRTDTGWIHGLAFGDEGQRLIIGGQNGLSQIGWSEPGEQGK